MRTAWYPTRMHGRGEVLSMSTFSGVAFMGTGMMVDWTHTSSPVPRIVVQSPDAIARP